MTTTKRQENEVNDISMRQWVHGVTCKDQERTHPRNNESGIGCQKITERRLNWYGHVVRRDEERIVREMLRTDIQEKGATENKMERRVTLILEK